MGEFRQIVWDIFMYDLTAADDRIATTLRCYRSCELLQRVWAVQTDTPNFEARESLNKVSLSTGI
jgi:hypothetical protein